MRVFRRRSWSPYAAGAAIGALETVAMATAGRPLGVTTAFEDAAAMAAEGAAPRLMGVERYEQARGEQPEVGWETGLVAGLVIGSWLSARLSRDPVPPAVPRFWRRRFGRSRGRRYAAAVGGGALMMFGARMAKGCTSGHGISGTMQFAASSWLFLPIMFASGAAVCQALLGRRK